MAEILKGTLDTNLARDWVRSRVSENRFLHITGVVTTARKLSAYMPDTNVESAEIAAWLHDACKEVPGTALLALAQKFGILLDKVDEQNPHLLHGPVASQVCRTELGLTDQAILDAIAEHTLGAAPMSPLSQIIFLADTLEASRPTHVTDPIWKALDLDRSPNFSSGIVAACDVTLQYLTEIKRQIHPRMVLVRNYYLEH